MAHPRRFTPEDFDGIFYSEDSGSEAIFELGAAFLEEIRERPDGLFLALGAHVDLRVYGKRPDIADALLAGAKEVWANADWVEIGQILASVDDLRQRRPARWQNQIFTLIKKAIMPKPYQMPENFEPYFLDKEVYQLLFAMRAAGFNHIRAAGADLCIAIKLLVGLYLNGATELVKELEKALPYFWDDVDLEGIGEFYEGAVEARATGSPTWLMAVNAAIDLKFRGVAAVGDALIASVPRRSSTIPEGFDGIFMHDQAAEVLFQHREHVVDMFAGRPEAGFVLAAMVVDLRINGYGELAEAILARAKETWSEFDFGQVDVFLAQSAELAEQQPEGWRDVIHELAHKHLEPKLPALPETYKAYFVPRKVLELLYANGAVDGLGIMRATSTPYYRVVKTLVVMMLNGDDDFVGNLELVLRDFYPEADMAQLHRLYDEVRKIKETYGTHWQSFANAHVEMTIRGHADINWVEGAA